MAVYKSHPGDGAEDAFGNAADVDHVALTAEGLPLHKGGRAARGIGLIEPGRRHRRIPDRVEEGALAGIGDLPVPGHRINLVGGQRLGRAGEGVGHRIDDRACRRNRGIPGDHDLARGLVDEAPSRNRRRAGTDSAEFCEAQVTGSVAREGPGAGDRISTERRRIAQLSNHSAQIDARLRRRKPRRIAESAANEVRVRLLGRYRLVRYGVVAHNGQTAVAGIDEIKYAGRVRAVWHTTVAVEIPVGPHEEVVAAADTTDRCLNPAPHGIDRDERLALSDEKRDVGERERRHVRGERREVEERRLRRWGDGNALIRLGRPGRVACKPDVVLDHPGDGVDWLEPHGSVRRSAVERGAQGRWQSAVARNSHIEPQLLGRVGRHRGVPRFHVA